MQLVGWSIHGRESLSSSRPIAGFVFLFAGQTTMQQRSHIRIFVICEIMPRWMQKAADALSLLLIVGFTFALVWGNYADAKRRFLRIETFGTAWDPPIPGSSNRRS